MQTKAVNLSEDEIMELINFHGRNVSDNLQDRVERLGYLHKRLKAFKEPEVIETIKSDNSAAGWGKTDA